MPKVNNDYEIADQHLRCRITKSDKELLNKASDKANKTLCGWIKDRLIKQAIIELK